MYRNDPESMYTIIFSHNLQAYYFTKSSFRGGKARCELVIQMAATTKEKKNADLVRLTELLNAEETLVVAAVNYKGLSVRNAFFVEFA